jgi:hypothetical protein
VFERHSQDAVEVHCSVCQTGSWFQTCWTCPAVIGWDSTCASCLARDSARSVDDAADVMWGEEPFEEQASNSATAMDDEASLCVICLERKRSHVLTPCGHLCVCAKRTPGRCSNAHSAAHRLTESSKSICDRFGLCGGMKVVWMNEANLTRREHLAAHIDCTFAVEVGFVRGFPQSVRGHGGAGQAGV